MSSARREQNYTGPITVIVRTDTYLKVVAADPGPGLRARSFSR